jgi:hypothetical protein
MKKWCLWHGWLNKGMSDLRARLTAVAAAGGTVGYGALAAEYGVRVSILTDALEALMAEDAALGQPLLAVVCVGRLLDGMPARGFFEAAARLGRDVADPVGFVVVERAALVERAGALPRTPR